MNRGAAFGGEGRGKSAIAGYSEPVAASPTASEVSNGPKLGDANRKSLSGLAG